jgi:hypothetical protein
MASRRTHGLILSVVSGSGRGWRCFCRHRDFLRQNSSSSGRALGLVVATERVCVSRGEDATSAAVKASSARSGSARLMHHSSQRTGGGELFLATPSQSGMAARREINVRLR